MFTTNQIYFAIFFIVFFSIAIIISYSKDKKNHKLHYKGAFKILIGFITAILILFLIKYFGK